MEWYPPELRKLRKAPFNCKLTHLLLKILEIEEVNVDLCYLDLLKISCVTGLVITCNIIITTLICYLFLFTHSCIYLIVVCVCMSVCVRELIQCQFR